MWATSDADGRRQAIRVGAGLFTGFALLAAVDAVAIALGIPLPRLRRLTLPPGGSPPPPNPLCRP